MLELPERQVPLPGMTELEEVAAEYKVRTLGTVPPDAGHEK